MPNLRKLILLSCSAALLLACGIANSIALGTRSSAGGNVDSPGAGMRPPGSGVWLYSGGGLESLYRLEGPPGARNSASFPSRDGPDILVWLSLPDIDFDYFELYEITTSKEFSFDAQLRDEGFYQVAVNSLPDGNYCFAQGNPSLSAVEIPHWCFRIGKPEEALTTSSGPEFCPDPITIEPEQRVEDILFESDGAFKCYLAELDGSSVYLLRINSIEGHIAYQIYDPQGNVIIDTWSESHHLVIRTDAVEISPEIAGPFYIALHGAGTNVDHVGFQLQLTDDLDTIVQSKTLGMEFQFGGGLPVGGLTLWRYKLHVTNVELAPTTFRMYFELELPEEMEGEPEIEARPERACILVYPLEIGNFPYDVSQAEYPIDTHLDVIDPLHYRGYLEYKRTPNPEIGYAYFFSWGCYPNRLGYFFSEYAVIPDE